MKREMPDDAIVRLIDLPPGIGGSVMEDEDGTYNIYINSRHGYFAQFDDLDHELAHIENDDLHNDDPIDVIEARADARTAKIKSIPRLMKARDLLPKPKPKPQPVPKTRTMLAPHQAAVLLRAISDLDSLFFDSKYDF